MSISRAIASVGLCLLALAAMPLTAVAQDTVAPSIPTGLAASNVYSTTLTLSWNASTDNVGVTAYEVFRNGQSLGTTTLRTLNQSSLASSTVYQFTVRARDAAGNWSNQSPICAVKTWQQMTYGGTIDFWENSDENGDPNGTYGHSSDSIQAFTVGASSPARITLSSSAQELSIESADWGWDDVRSFEGTVPSGIHTIVVSGTTDDAHGDYQLVVEFKPPNQLPVANYSITPSFGRAPFSPTFNGNLSSDPDGLVVGYAWDFDNNGTTDGTGITGTTTYSNTSTSPITYSSKLTVTDLDGGTANVVKTTVVYPATSVGVTVTNGATNPPFVMPGGTVTLTANVPAPGLQFSTWTLVSGSGTFASAGSATTTFTIGSGDAVVRADYVADTTPPGPPTNVHVVAATSTTFSIGWTAATDNMGVTGYEVFLNGISFGTTPVPSLDVADLDPSTLYTITVRARDAASNWSIPSAPAPAKTWSRTVWTGTITNWDNEDGTHSASSDSYSINFTAETPFIVSFQATPDDLVLSSDFAGGSSSSGSVGAGWHYINVAGIDDYSSGDYQLTVELKPPNVSPVPAFAQTPAFGRAPLLVSFDGSTSTDPDGVITAWAWDFDNNGTTDATGVNATTTYANTGTSAMTYTAKLKVTDLDGATATTTHTTAVYPATSIGITAQGGTTSAPYQMSGSTVSLTAAPPTTGLQFSGWTIVSPGTGSFANASAPVTTFTVGSTDTVVQANYVADVTPPGAPTNVHVTDAAGDYIVLAWNAATDNVSVASYEVFRDGVSVGTTTSPTATVSSLTPSTIYQFTVRAKDPAGNSSVPSAALLTRTWQRLLFSGTIHSYENLDPDGNPDGTYSTTRDGPYSFTISASTPAKITLESSGDLVFQDSIGQSYTSISGTLTGPYTYLQYVTGASDTAEGDYVLCIDLNPPGNPPIAAFTTTPAIGRSPCLVALNGSSSFDLEGPIASYGWDFTNSGTINATTVTASTTLTNTGGSAVVKTIRLNVTDVTGNSGSTTRTVLVYPASSPGVSVTGGTTSAPYVTGAGASATITADPAPAGKVFFSWTLVSGSGTLVDPTARVTTYISGSNDAVLRANYIDDTSPPSPPVNLAVGNVHADSLTLSWQPSTDNVGVARYDVYQYNMLLGSTTGLSMPVQNLSTLTVYQFSVRAVDANGLVSAPASTPPVKTWQEIFSSSGAITAGHSQTFSFAISPATAVKIYTTGNTATRGTLTGPNGYYGTVSGNGDNFVLTDQLDAGVYSIVVNGQTENDEGDFGIGVAIGATVQADFKMSSDGADTGPVSIDFDASASYDAVGSNIVSYAWDFDGNGTTDATGLTASHTYGTGFYTARLTVANATGATSTITRKVAVGKQTVQAISPAVATPSSARIGTTVAISTPALQPNPPSGTVAQPFHAWLGTMVDNTFSATTVATVLPSGDFLSANYWSPGWETFPDPISTLSLNGSSARRNDIIVATATISDLHNSAATVTSVTIDYSTDYGFSWVAGTIAAGTKWQGSQVGSRPLIASFNFNSPGLVIFRTMGTMAIGPSTYYSYKKVFIRTAAEDDVVTVVNGTGVPPNGPAGTVVTLSPPPGTQLGWWEKLSGQGTFGNQWWPWTSFTKGAGSSVLRFNAGLPSIITVVSGTTDRTYGGGGTECHIAAAAAPAGQVFDQWLQTGQGTLADAFSSSTTFVIGDGNATLQATYRSPHVPLVVLATDTPIVVTGTEFTIMASGTDPDVNDLKSLTIDWSLDDGVNWILGTADAQGAAKDPTRWDGLASGKTLPVRFLFSQFFGTRYRFRARSLDQEGNYSRYAYLDVFVRAAKPSVAISATTSSLFGKIETPGSRDPVNPPTHTITLADTFGIEAVADAGSKTLWEIRIDLSKNGQPWREGTLANQQIFQLEHGGFSHAAFDKQFMAAELGVGTYRFRAVAYDGDFSDYDYVTVIIVAQAVAPTITTQPAAQIINVGGNHTFRTVAAGTVPLSYQWLRNGTPLSGATTNTFTIASAQSADAGSYSVVVTNSAGTVTSSSATLTVNGLPLAAFSANRMSGDAPLSVAFDASASSDADGTISAYHWEFGDGQTASGLTASHVYNAVVNTATYMAKLVVTDNRGATGSTTHTISVSPLAGGGADTDGDGLPDAWESLYGDALVDFDKDGWTNVAEYNRNTDPSSPSSPALSTLGDAPLDSAWPLASTPSEYIGFTPGTAGVNLSGAATYSIPIKVTPGSVGMQPNLSLEYSSQASDSFVGLGWQLHGLPAITRGPKTIATDGVAKGMNFSDDRFYLDGARLIAINGGTYGANLTEYRTEIDSFSRIISYTTTGTDPDSFKVWTKSGQVLEFGGLNDPAQPHPRNARLTRLISNVASGTLIWAVNKISDLNGNSMLVTYTPDDPSDEILPDTIVYTCNAAAPTGYATVKFIYRDRDDPQTGYAFDMPTASTKLLKTITIKSGTNVFRQYRLAYDDGTTTQPSRLKSIQEATEEAEASTKVYPPTTFRYFDPPASGLTFGVATSQSLPDGTSATGQNALTADMDGDGLTDIVRIANRSSAYVQCWRNDGTSFHFVSEKLALNGKDFMDGFLVTDMDGDGRSEVVINPALHAGQPRGKVRQMKLNAANNQLEQVDVSIANFSDSTAPAECYSGDFTGDGRDDLLLIYRQDPFGPCVLQLLQSTGTGYTATTFTVPEMKNGLFEVGDFNGDGIADILNVTDEANDRRIRIFTISPSGAVKIDETVLGIKRADWRTMIADVNGDGQLDLLYSYKDTDGSNSNANRVEIWMREGYGSGGTRFVKVGNQVLGDWNPDSFRYCPFDYDGDRKSDIAMLYTTGGQTRVDVWQAAGPLSSPFTRVSIGTVKGTVYPTSFLLPAQLDRDGLGDLLFMGIGDPALGSALPYPDTVRLLSKPSASDQSGSFPNLLSVVTNGLGAKTKFSYLSLLEDDIFTKGTGSTWPDADVRPAFRVVSIMESDRPGGTTETSQYSYGGLQLNAQRGFRGFEWIKRKDSSTGFETTNGYNRAFPLTNLPSYSEVRTGAASDGGTLLSRTEYTTASSSTGGVYRPYVATTYSKEYDLAANPVRTRYTNAVQDDYGNITSNYERSAPGELAQSSMLEGPSLPAGYFERKITTESFAHDTSGTNWLIGRPTRVVTTAKSGDYPNESDPRVVEIGYYTGKNQVQYTTQEPDTGNEAFRLKTEYTYDAYGNVDSVTVSSPGAGTAAIETRTTHTDYGVTTPATEHPIAGRFPKEVKDALDQKTTFTYDWVTGKLKRRKDEATGLQTTWNYDEFGAQTLETRPDLTTTTTAYRLDSTSVAMENGSSITAAYHVDLRTSGAPPSLTRYDALGLAIQQQSVAGDAITRFTETRYDDRGNVAASSRPHTAAGAVFWTTTLFDALNRPTSRQIPAPPPPGSAPGTPSGQDVFTWAYSGLSVTETDARNLETTRTANALGLPESVENNPTFSTTAPDRSKLTRKYDGFGNLRAITDAANNTVDTTYDRLGRKIQVIDPNMGTWGYSYYANGLLHTQADAKTNTTTLTYDKLDRLKDKTIGNRVVSWFYNVNASTGTTTTPLNGARQLDHTIVMEDSTQVFKQTWTYDSQSRVSDTSRIFGGKTYSFGQSYDTYGRPDATTYPAGTGPSPNGPPLVTHSVYSAIGSLKEIRRHDTSYSPGNLGQIFWQAAAYDDDGQLSLAYLGNGAAVDRLHYAENGRPAGDSISVNSPIDPALPPLLMQSYGFDGVGNLISHGSEFTKVNGTQASYTETFTYDGMNRVSTVNLSGVTNPTHSYGYDQIGNILSKDGQTYDYTRTISTEPLAPHAVRSTNLSGTVVTYSYDANGNMKGNNAGSVVAWRAFNQPDQITLGTQWSKFTYGADDERIIQDTQDNTQTRYVGSLYEVTIPQGTASLTEVRAYVMTPFGRTAVLQFNDSGTLVSTRYLTQDQINSTSLVTDEAGRVRERFSYDPWGAPRDAETLAASSPWPTRQATTRGFTDHEMLSRLNLVHMNGRIYNPALGRFLSPDPLVNDADGPQQLNRYAYVRNNPLSLADPTGFTTTPYMGGDDIVHLPSFTVSSPKWTTSLLAWSSPSWTPLNFTVGFVTNPANQATNNSSSPNSWWQRFGQWAYYNARNDEGETPADMFEKAMAARKRGREIDQAYGDLAFIGMINELTGANALMAGIFGADLDLRLLGPGERWFLGISGSVQMVGTSLMLAEGSSALRGFAAETEMATVYRGVGKTTNGLTPNPGYGPALEGNAFPRGTVADAAAHNSGFTENSAFTSWTTERSIAIDHATKNGSGVLLEARVPASRLTPSPDNFNELEVLIRGPVRGATPKPVTGF